MKFAAEQAKGLGLELDDRLLHHLGFLFMRDPMIIFSDRIYVDDSLNTNHFEVLGIYLEVAELISFRTFKV